MLAIRLQRIGKKNKPSYRLVVSDKKKDLYGRHNEILGSYDPTSNPKKISLKAERIKHWISVGAQPSPTVHNLLISNNVIEGKKVKAWTPKKKEKDAKAQEAPKAPSEPKPSEEPKPEAEAPKTEEEKPVEPEAK